MIRAAFAVTSSLLVFALPALADDTTGLVPRTEILSFASLTLSDQQFLVGDTSGTSVTLAGELRIAKLTGPQPLVILMHGSGGIAANIGLWQADLAALGISSFALDGFSGRGITQTSTNQALLGRLNFILDVYRALAVLAKHPRVDPQRIALMGFSRGGQAALYASLKRFHEMWNKSGGDFAAYLPFYPDCSTTFIGDTELSPSPIHLFGGTVDDYNPIAKCKAYAERLKSVGREIAITEYPNASHAFDNPLLPDHPFVANGGQTVRNCVIREEPHGILIDAQTGQPFTYADPCVELTPHLGFDPEATSQVRPVVASLLKSVFKLE